MLARHCEYIPGHVYGYNLPSLYYTLRLPVHTQLVFTKSLSQPHKHTHTTDFLFKVADDKAPYNIHNFWKWKAGGGGGGKII